MKSPEESPGAEAEILGQKIQGFEVGQEFPASVEVNGQSYLRSNEIPERGWIYGRRIKSDYPAQEELLLVDREGKIIFHRIVDEAEQARKRIEG